MRRVAITGIGIVSSIGNHVEEVTASLRNGTSGIVAAPEYAELGFRSQVHGTVKLDVTEHIDRKQLRFMGEGAAYAVLAMEQAIADAGLDDHLVSHIKTGLVAGSGGPPLPCSLTPPTARWGSVRVRVQLLAGAALPRGASATVR